MVEDLQVTCSRQELVAIHKFLMAVYDLFRKHFLSQPAISILNKHKNGFVQIFVHPGQPNDALTV